MEEILKKIVSYVKVVGGPYERDTSLGDLSGLCNCNYFDVINGLFQWLDDGFLISVYNDKTGKFEELKKSKGLKSFEKTLTSCGSFKIRIMSPLLDIEKPGKIGFSRQ